MLRNGLAQAVYSLSAAGLKQLGAAGAEDFPGQPGPDRKRKQLRIHLVCAKIITVFPLRRLLRNHNRASLPAERTGKPFSVIAAAGNRVNIALGGKQ